ncbi:hypothetical protein N7510_005175 [Penicillium lagena]|uniref:uncharacterized protein n=1 Tax=Penicillium lagena TaxID=94218 RepID=UPI00254128D8|nr:uncharacterized protein N7510_005175 [Penicillium lagena]KAJ5611981.1 hypothetical protein N7510_005175 [Penicillium lagena]
MEIDGDTSDMSYQCDSDDSDFSDTTSTSSIELNPPAPLPLHNNGDVSSSLSRHSANRPRILDGLPEFSDDPDDETDEDIANVPLDYGQSDQTKTRRQRIEHRWHKYCQVKTAKSDASPIWKDPEEALRQSTSNDIYRFFNYCMKLKRGQDGRHLKGISKASALRADWKGFRGYYRQINRRKISPEDSEEINAGIRKLIDKYGLNRHERGKEPVYVHDLTEFNETILRTQEKRFHLGYERIQLCLYTMLGIFTVNRLNALLSLQFKHLQLSIQRDPEDGPPILLVEIKSEHTKKFMGTSQANNFPFPEIIDDPSLIFSPHAFIFGILFWLQAFEVPELSSMEQVRKLLVQSGCQQMPLPLRPEVEEHYVFCRVHAVLGTPGIQWESPMSVGTMSDRLKSLGEIHGWLHSMFSHRFRYAGGKMLNESDEVSQAQQNLIMKHSDTKTFLDHYLPRHIDTDMQSIMNGRKSNKHLMRAITRMSRWIDKRRPRHLTAAQRESLRNHPEYLEVKQRRDEQAAAYRETPDIQSQLRLDKLTRDVANTFSRLERTLRDKIRKEFDRKQAIIDIERQLSGSAVDDEVAKELLRTEDHMLPEQIYLLEKLLTWPVSKSLEAEWERRNAAVAAISQYCSVQEGGPLRGRRKRLPPNDGINEKPTSIAIRPLKINCVTHGLSQRDLLLQQAEEHIKASDKPLRCFQCYGNTTLPDHRRAQEWSEYKSILRHFRRQHLDDRRCHMCSVDLLHEMHLRRHAEEVHRLCTQRRSRTSDSAG